MSAAVAFDEFFLHLPGDPEEAFVVYQKRCLEEFEAENSAEFSGWMPQRHYVDKILAFDEVFGLGLFTSWSDPPAFDNNFGDFFYPFKLATEKAALKFQLERARRVSSSSQALLVFDQNSRMAIHKLIDAIRQELSKLHLSERKRSSLFEKLNNFTREVDQNLSRTESFYRFAVEIGQLAKGAGEAIKPVADRVDRIIDILDRAQTWLETLPPWVKRKEIPAPPKQIEGPGPSDEGDDSIPF